MEILENTKFVFNDTVLDSSFFDHLSVMQAGSIYDVFKVKNGKSLFLQQHINRVKQSFLFKEINFDYNVDFIVTQINKVIQSNNIHCGNIKMVFHPEASAIYIYQIKHRYPTKANFADGVDVITLNIERPTPNVKQVNSYFRTTTDAIIADKNVYEVILINDSGFVTEGSRTNVFFIFKDIIVTPPTNAVLPGVTRGIVMSICNDLGLTCTEENIAETDIIQADAIFLTGTSPDVLPIKKVNEFEFKTQNIILKQIMTAFEKLL